MKLRELIEAVKEKSLTKTQLEDYRDDLSNVSAQMFLEMAEIEKQEAIYLDSAFSTELTEAARKRKWAATQIGLRQIELKNYIRASDKILSSLRSRLYSIY